MADAVGYVLQINGVTVAQPSSLKYIRSDLDSENSFRTLSGKMQRDRITTKVKIECEWRGLDAGQISELLTSMDAVFFPVTFLDPYTGTFNTLTMYVGDRSAPMLTFANGRAIYETFSANFIEQ